ncbi:histidinol-phosphate transaminase [Lipingzhangella sp. LS1_29]|uniref:Histidinol-phosphate aminotransferase n=1 Tax=Lipingzhangella rawalii TaxID=2055835 RepID=A0ABU2H3G5_9ACTN|nr:histidinol-phosphate transaminase [Lipingzhangella rawalii]MDS1269360.1 histidinol-phosphate transaminase [Lipingzhangella rawalii]
MSELGLDQLPVRADLRGMTPYGAPQLEVPVALNTNENPIPPSAELSAAIGAAVAETARGLNRYPDRDATRLRADLARYLGHGLSQENVWAANGSNEILQQLLHVFGGPGRTALGFEPSYSMHPVLARVTGTAWMGLDRGQDFRIDPEEARAAVARHQPTLVLLTSPNNPTGTALELETVEAVAETCPGVVVVDEAYAEFRREGTPSAVSLLERYPRLIVTRTMSKAFALAGARIGYLAAHPAAVEALQLVRLPYHLSATSQVVAKTALDHATELLASVDELRAERDACVTWLRNQGYTVADSDANFVMFGTFSDRSAVWNGLLERGVLVREVGPPGWLRVTVGTATEMARFRAALLEVTHQA